MARTVTEIADAYVEQVAATDPVRASRLMGVGRDTPHLTDYSPEGHAALASVYRSTLADLAAATPADEAERLGAAYLQDICAAHLGLLDAGEPHQMVSAIAGPPSQIRLSFDVMPRDGDDAWERVAARIEDVPRALESYRASLRASAEQGRVSSRRLTAAVADQCDTWARAGWFTTYVGEYRDGKLAPRLAAAAQAANAAYSDLGRWMRDDYAPLATPNDGVGADRYRLWARMTLGTELDLDEAYTWAEDELARLEEEQRRECERILPGASFAEVTEHLEEHGEAVEGVDGYRAKLQDILDEATEALAGVEFDIAPELRTCVVGIPPEGTAAAPYYSPPSEDLSEPGTTWFPTMGRTRFPTWQSYTTIYHEAVPGHHLQLGVLRLLPLVRAQRVGGNAAHAEGWALYAERLMDELGWFKTPAPRVGFLAMQIFRALRIVVDIGLHTGRDGWDFDRAVDAAARVLGRRDFAESEVLRYLSWPSQATSYKLGERTWLAGRAAAMAAAGQAFDRKAWHSRALGLGPLGLDRLERELAAL